MQWKTIVNQGAEVGFVTIRNDSDTAYSAGQVVVWVMDGTNDGLDTDDPGSTNAGLVVGLAHTAVADDTTGLAQVYGLDTDAICLRRGSASNDAVAVGDYLDINSAASNLMWTKGGGAALAETFAATNNAAATVVPPMFVAAAAVVSGGASSASTSACKVFLRCL